MTQNERILRHLHEYGTITSLEALSEYGIMRLASRINDIKRKGVDIKTETVYGKNRFGEVTRYAKYSLAQKEAAAPPEPGTTAKQ